MGGLMILSGLVVSTLLWANLRNSYVWIVLFVTVGFGLIGFYDDYLKVTKQTHAGFSGRLRLALEFVIAGLACYAMMRGRAAQNMTTLAIPMVKGYVATSALSSSSSAPSSSSPPAIASISPTDSTASPSCP